MNRGDLEKRHRSCVDEVIVHLSRPSCQIAVTVSAFIEAKSG